MVVGIAAPQGLDRSSGTLAPGWIQESGRPGQGVAVNDPQALGLKERFERLSNQLQQILKLLGGAGGHKVRPHLHF